MKLRKPITLVAKVAAVLALNAVFLHVLSADRDAPTQSQHASADIADFMPQSVFAPASTSAIVKDSGLTPRKYNINGNDVYFAVGETMMSPREVLEHYQTEFAAAGINSRKYLESPQQKINGDPEKFKLYGAEAQEVVDAMSDGEVVPYLVTNNYISMGGPIITADSFKEILEEWGPTALDDPNRVMKGWRFIDARRKATGTTEVTSIWADENFDFNKFRNPNGARIGLNPAVPACPGCRLVLRSNSVEESMSVDQYASQASPEAVRDFYVKSMTARGWELSDTTRAMEHAAQHVPDHPFNTRGPMLSFSKGDQHVTYTILASENGAVVTANHAW